MMEFLEFCRMHPWEMGIILYAAMSFGAVLGYVIASRFADYRMADKLIELHNPANVSRRIEKQGVKQ